MTTVRHVAAQLSAALVRSENASGRTPREFQTVVRSAVAELERVAENTDTPTSFEFAPGENWEIPALETARDDLRTALQTGEDVPRAMYNAVASISRIIDPVAGDATEYVVELKGPVDLELFDPNVAHDEIDEDPPSIESGQFGADDVEPTWSPLVGE